MKNLIVGLLILGIITAIIGFITSIFKATAFLISFISLVSAVVIAIFRYLKKEKVISG